MSIRVGTLCYAVEQGLGILARSFIQAGVVTDTLIVKHSSRTNHPSWYPGARMISGSHKCDASRNAAFQFAAEMDVMLFFETAFHNDLFQFCKQRSIKTVLMPMHECHPQQHFNERRFHPDLFLCPSHLELEVFRATKVPCVHLTVPVTPAVKRRREKATVFVHNAGHGGLRGRNGTGTLIDATKLVKDPSVKLILRSQERLRWGVDDPRIDLRVGTFPYETLFDEGDVYVHPTRFDALSLPIQEAYASGMPVITGDRFPMNAWLPKDTLVPIRSYNKARVGGGYLEFDEAVYDPADLATTIEHWHNKDISHLSDTGLKWGEDHSWAVMAPKYTTLLENLLAGHIR